MCAVKGLRLNIMLDNSSYKESKSETRYTTVSALCVPHGFAFKSCFYGFWRFVRNCGKSARPKTASGRGGLLLDLKVNAFLYHWI